MAEVTFSHPLMSRPLLIDTKPDQIVWNYGLNTAVYPTFGGEVVQILSVYFDDMTVAGTVSSYAELEAIYSWFITYMQYATQGRTDPSFDQHPVKFDYPQRGWTFQIWPKALPGFRYGRDVVAPTWKLIAAVKEPDATVADQIKNLATFNASKPGKFATFGKATADFGITGDLTKNPWASPDADPALRGKTMSSYLAKQVGQLADTFNAWVGDFSNDKVSSLPGFSDASKPAKANTATAPGKKSGTGKKTAKRVGP